MVENGNLLSIKRKGFDYDLFWSIKIGYNSKLNKSDNENDILSSTENLILPGVGATI